MRHCRYSDIIKRKRKTFQHTQFALIFNEKIDKFCIVIIIIIIKRGNKIYWKFIQHNDLYIAIILTERNHLGVVIY